MTKARNPHTNTVHYAKTVGGDLVQECGTAARQRAYLEATDAAVTCARCAKTAPAAAPVAKTAPARYGRQEWSLTELRAGAKLAGLKGYTRLSGDELLAKLVEVAPQWG